MANIRHDLKDSYVDIKAALSLSPGTTYAVQLFSQTAYLYEGDTEPTDDRESFVKEGVKTSFSLTITAEKMWVRSDGGGYLILSETV